MVDTLFHVLRPEGASDPCRQSPYFTPVCRLIIPNLPAYNLRVIGIPLYEAAIELCSMEAHAAKPAPGTACYQWLPGSLNMRQRERKGSRPFRPVEMK